MRLVKFLQEEKIDVKAAKKSIMNAANDIFDKPDEKIIDDMIANAKSKAKDTEDLVQIVINMMRSE